MSLSLPSDTYSSSSSLSDCLSDNSSWVSFMPLDSYTSCILFCCLVEGFKEFINICLENREIGRLVIIESHILSALNRNEVTRLCRLRNKSLSSLSLSAGVF